MSTKIKSKAKKKQKDNVDEYLQIYNVGKTPPPEPVGDSLNNLMNAMSKVDTKSPEAEANATSISDNNGGRIELNEDLKNPKVIKK